MKNRSELRFLSSYRYNFGDVQNDPDSSTAVKTLTSMLTPAINKQIPAISRAIGLLLVVFILYGTTVEAAHKHSRVLTSTAETASVATPGTTDTSMDSKAGCHDCLLCQLHQNFSATLISFRPATGASDKTPIARGFDPISILSRINTPRSGRAPPQAN